MTDRMSGSFLTFYNKIWQILGIHNSESKLDLKDASTDISNHLNYFTDFDC